MNNITDKIRKELISPLMKNATMPRTSMRYAMEKMPSGIKSKGDGKIIVTL